AFVAGAHQTKNPFAVLAQRGPGFLAVNDVVVAFAFGLAFDRGEIRSRTWFAVALAPPDFAAGDTRQETLLLFLVAKGHDHGRDHHRPEGHDARCTGQRALLFKEVFLHGSPAWPTKLFGPAMAQPALFAQDLGPALHVVAC